MRPEDVPTDLPEHPREALLREREDELAETICETARKASQALSAHDRVPAAVELARLAQVAATGQKAMVRAIQDQMDQMAG